MKQSLAALLVAALSTAAVASTPATDTADHLMAVVRGADSVSIEFYSSSGKEEITFSDAIWIERLAAALAFNAYKLQSHCFCVSYPTIRLLRKKEVVGTLSVHHGEKLRAYTGKVSGDFLVGARAGKAIVELANEKKKG